MNAVLVIHFKTSRMICFQYLKSLQNVKITLVIIKLFVVEFLGSNVLWPYIQGVTRGMCETSGECSLGQTIPI